MINKKDNKLNGLLGLLSPAVSSNLDTVRTEPLTYHRRGQWFKSSTAHQREQ